MKFLKITLIYLFFAVELYSQQNISVDALYSNINILSEKISNLSIKVRNLGAKLDKSNTELHTKLNSYIKLIDSIKVEINNDKNNLLSLTESLTLLNKNLISNTKQIQEINEDIKTYQNQFTKINSELQNIDDRITSNEAKINKLYNLFFSSDSYPIFSVSFSLRYFLELMSDHIQKPLSVVGSLNINLNKDYQLWLDISAPFEFITSNANPGDSIRPEPTWTSYLGSLGIKNKFYSKSNLDVKAGLGLFYGKILLKENIYNVVNTESPVYPYGLTGKLEISYNQFIYRNPLEIYFEVAGYLANQNIILRSKYSTDINFGSFLISASLGFRFNFW